MSLFGVIYFGDAQYFSNTITWSYICIYNDTPPPTYVFLSPFHTQGILVNHLARLLITHF